LQKRGHPHPLAGIRNRYPLNISDGCFHSWVHPSDLCNLPPFCQTRNFCFLGWGGGGAYTWTYNVPPSWICILHNVKPNLHLKNTSGSVWCLLLLWLPQNSPWHWLHTTNLFECSTWQAQNLISFRRHFVGSLDLHGLLFVAVET
jgi:hypothetical protein